jgi:magnesium chelatase subunit D
MQNDINRDAAEPTAFPFSAVVGMDLAKQALLLLAVDPGLKGVLIAASPGTAKSVLARSFASLLPGASFVEVPLGVADDHLLGGLHLERTLLTGRRQSAPGLLARAHRGVLYAEGLHRLDRTSTHHIAGALNAGMVRLEREGLSAEFPSEFVVIGTCDPEEAAVSDSLANSVGIHVTETGGSPNVERGGERVEILHRLARFDHDPLGFARQFAAETAALRRRIAQARSRLPKVNMKRGDLRRLSLAALRLGVEGHRADLFAVRVARAHAALQGRVAVEREDLDAAVQFVLMPRAMFLPQPRAAVPPERDAASPDRSEAQDAMSEGYREGQTTRDGAEAPGAHPPHGPLEDQIVEPLDCSAPEEILALPRQNLPQKASEHSGRRNHNSPERVNWNRGHFVRAVAGRSKAGKIALAATLRAAAPHQTERRSAAKANSLQPAIQVAARDLRFKQFRQKAGMLVIFAVDASGSMAANRIHLAKGALLRLLEKAYVHRDKVALISFRGDKSEVLLPPTRSVELAKRVLDALPVGGGTPLAAGLEAVLSLARQARPGDGGQKLLVLVTDGTANVTRRKELSAGGAGRSSREAIWRELEEVSELLRRERVESVVIDTRHRLVSRGEAERLAELLGGRHVPLPRPDADAVYNSLAAARRS